jgi:hypothetical protein
MKNILTTSQVNPHELNAKKVVMYFLISSTIFMNLLFSFLVNFFFLVCLCLRVVLAFFCF